MTEKNEGLLDFVMTEQSEGVVDPGLDPKETKTRGPLKFSIGGIEFCLEWQLPKRVGWSHPFYEPFLGEGNETIQFHVHFDECPKFPGKILLFDGENHWKLYRQDSRYLFEAFDRATKTRTMICSFEDGFQTVEVYVFPVSSEYAHPSWSLHRLMNPLGQWLLVNRLAALGGIMMHALAIDDQGRGILFVGPSGSGKSTLARFWRRRKGVRILGDERVILRRQGSQFYAYGTPWPGDAFTVSSIPVAIQRIFFIEHHPEQCVWNESKGLFASRLFSQLFLPLWNHRAVASVFKVCQELVETVECERLGFTRHPSVIDFVRNSKRRNQ